MCSPSPPPAPDFTAAANAQGAANRETALAQGHINNPNVVNPYGRQTVTWDGEQPTITQELSPAQRALLDQRNQTQQLLGGLAQQGAGSLQGLIGSQVDFSGLPQRPNALGYQSSPMNFPSTNPARRGMGPIMGGPPGPPQNGNPASRGPFYPSAPPSSGGNPALGGGTRTFSPRTPVLKIAGADDSMSLNPGRMPISVASDSAPGMTAKSAAPTVGQALGLSPSDPRYNLKEGDPYPSGGIVARNPDGSFTIGPDNMSGPLAGTSYGHYFNNTQGDGFTGTRNGQNFINGNLYTGEGLNQDNGTPNPDSGFNTYARQALAAFQKSAPNDPRTQALQKYLSGVGPATAAPPIPGNSPPEAPPAPSLPPGTPPSPPPSLPPGSPPGNPPALPPGSPPNPGGGDFGGGGNFGGGNPSNPSDGYGGIPLPQVQNTPDALNPNRLPSMAGPLDSNALPYVGTADQVRQQVIDAMMGRSNQDLDKATQQKQSDLIAAGIRPGTEAYQREMDMLGRQKNDALQQAQIAGGNAAAQQFGMDLSRRQQATGEQGQSFQQSSANRGMSAGEQQQRFQQLLTGGAQKFGQQGQVSQLMQQLQGQGYTQQSQNRRDAIAELLAQRQTPLNEISTLMGGSGVSNPFSVPGYNGNTSVAPPPIFGAAQAQQGANNNMFNAQTGTYNSMLSGLGSLGGAAIGAFF